MQISHLIKQKAYERIEYLLRRHYITFVPTVLLFLILILVPGVIYFLINNLYPHLLAGEIFYPLSILFASIYYLSLFLFFYAQFIDFYLDIWIVTNDRIVDIEQFGLFSRSVSEADLFRIQDVTVDVSGFWATILHYGNLTVKTASNNIHMVFYNIPHPNEVRQALIHLSDEDAKHHRQTT
ncbi:MAG: PH domain-containing protein [Candidatus Magasanikiibacteriota bacterium]